MKKLITSIISSLTLCSLACSQSISSNGNATATASGGYEYPKPETITWKDDRVASRRDFYAAKTAFDPTAEYEPIYNQSASTGLTPKLERGVAKLMDGNAQVQVVYYNNASVGTILRLCNPNNGKVTYAIVVGKIPPTEGNSYLLMLSERVARNLGMKDYSSIESICYTPATR
ncbi:MAG: hypothetical protein JWO03_1118 [Bacteroidetes bacterium]|nr:hypothetical protein [Bacteroidota bacterium]